MNDILHRIRWPNVARAAAVLSAVALLISWPHLRGRTPELPPATAAPAAVEPAERPDGDAAKRPAPAATARGAETRRAAKTPTARPKAKPPAPRHRPATRHRARRPPHHRPASRSTPAPVPDQASAPPPAYVPPAPPPPSAAEFRP